MNPQYLTGRAFLWIGRRGSCLNRSLKGIDCTFETIPFVRYQKNQTFIHKSKTANRTEYQTTKKRSFRIVLRRNSRQIFSEEAWRALYGARNNNQQPDALASVSLEQIPMIKKWKLCNCFFMRYISIKCVATLFFKGESSKGSSNASSKASFGSFKD